MVSQVYAVGFFLLKSLLSDINLFLADTLLDSGSLLQDLLSYQNDVLLCSWDLTYFVTVWALLFLGSQLTHLLRELSDNGLLVDIVAKTLNQSLRDLV